MASLSDDEIVRFFELTTKIFVEALNIYSYLINSVGSGKLDIMNIVDFFGFDTEISIYEILDGQSQSAKENQ